jgi:hypothetical protein
MHLRLRAALAGAIVCATSVSAQAEAPDFGYVYTAETEERGETELALWATDRRGKGAGRYAAQDYKLEIEHGFTNRFGASLYAQFASHDLHGLAPEFDDIHRQFGFQGMSAEFKYNVVKAGSRRVGLTFYAEPGWSRIGKVTGDKTDEYELEIKAIMQKNFAHDRLVWATNLTLEPEWERERETIAAGVVTRDTETELGIEVSTGLSYNIARHWWVGGEGRYHSVYPDWTHGLHRENYAVYAGPSVRYDGGEWSVTASWQPQLFGGPGAADRGLEFDDHEKREFRLKLSKEF